MGIGAIVGSAIFNILVIPALSGIATDGDPDTNRTIVYKEAQFYMIAAAATLIITFALAVISRPVPDGPELTGQLTRPLASLLLYGLYLFIQWQDVSDHEAEDAPTGISVGHEWGTLAVGLLVILVAVEQLVGGVESLSQTFGIPEFLAGITIIAAATSLPDTLVSVRSAKADKGITSLGNVLGSNTFDLLVAIPIGVLIVGECIRRFRGGRPDARSPDPGHRSLIHVFTYWSLGYEAGVRRATPGLRLVRHVDHRRNRRRDTSPQGNVTGTQTTSARGSGNDVANVSEELVENL